jgi:Methyltransferase FkbM domain
VTGRTFADHPFVLVDVGCALGIDPAWRMFGADLVAHGLDPQVVECARLNAAETHPNIRYHALFVGLPDDHPFRAHRHAHDESRRAYFLPLERTSALRATGRQPSAEHEAAEAVAATDNWPEQQLATEKTTVTEFLRREGISSVDFVKIDTDGSDLEAAISCEDAFRPTGILGLLIESPFWGTDAPDENTFHNIDRYMKQQGFLLFGMTVNRYSRAALPRPFVYRAPYQTHRGQPMWGDILYLRDAGSPHYEEIWGSSLSVTKLLKLVCLFDLFDLPDCAAEVVLNNRTRLEEAVDPDAMLDLLTPPLAGRELPYRTYTAAFDDDIGLFYPPSEAPAGKGGADVRLRTSIIARKVLGRLGVTRAQR